VQPDLPASLLDTSAGAPLPAVVSAALAGGPERLVPGATFQLIVAGAPRTLRVVEVRDAFPTLGRSDRWAVVSLDGLRAGASASEIHVTDAFLRAPDAAAAAIRAAATTASPNVAVASRAEETAALRAAPVVGSVSLGVTLATLVAALYAALAVAAALVLAGASRAIEVAHLRTLGLTGRQSVWLAIGEHGPAVGVALVVGSVLGFGLFVAIRSGLGLGAVIGSDVDVPLTVDPARLATVVALSLGAVAIGVAVAAVFAWRTAPALAIRRRME
jgi:putative ABC transport system permease protein